MSVNIPLPEEWDFRAVTPERVEIVVAYEYLRESIPMRLFISKWMSKPFQDWSFRPHRDWYKTLRKKNKITVGEAFKRFHLKCELVTAEIQEELLEFFDENPIPHVTFGMLRTFPEFPRPILSIANGNRLKEWDNEHARLWEGFPNGIRKEAGRPNRSRSHDIGKKAATASYDLIDWRLSDSALVNLFRKHLRANRPHKPDQVRPSGRRSDDPFVRLKRLAAKRLANANQSYSRAQKLINEQVRKIQLPDAYGVLPKYQHRAAWNDAVKIAESLILKTEDI